MRGIFFLPWVARRPGACRSGEEQARTIETGVRCWRTSSGSEKSRLRFRWDGKSWLCAVKAEYLSCPSTEFSAQLLVDCTLLAEIWRWQVASGVWARRPRLASASKGQALAGQHANWIPQHAVSPSRKLTSPVPVLSLQGQAGRLHDGAAEK